jgi:hypothetical protein
MIGHQAITTHEIQSIENADPHPQLIMDIVMKIDTNVLDMKTRIIDMKGRTAKSHLTETIVKVIIILELERLLMIDVSCK